MERIVSNGDCPQTALSQVNCEITPEVAIPGLFFLYTPSDWDDVKWFLIVVYCRVCHIDYAV